MADRYDDLNPLALTTTLRSLRRRFDDATGPVRSDDELLAKADRPGPEGSSLVEILDHTLRAVAVLAAEATRISTHVDPVSPAEAFDPSSWTAGDAPTATLREATDVIAATADELADLLDRQEPDGWNRTATLTGGGTIRLIDVVRSVVRQAVEGLRRAERTVAWMQEG